MMNRRLYLAASILVVLSGCDTRVDGAPPASGEQERVTKTVWDIYPSLGLDAVVFLGVLSGDELQSAEYRDEIATFQERLNDEELAALGRLGEAGRRLGYLVGPFWAYLFSVGETATFDDVLMSAEDPEARLRAGYENTPSWNATAWPILRTRLEGDVATALRGLRRAGFEEYWHNTVAPVAHTAAISFTDALSGYDIIAAQERYLGRPLDETLEVVLLHFSRPYGMRICGQRFVTHHGYLPREILLTAAHETFHPPFDLSNQSILDAFTPLSEDPWMVSIIRDHDPSFGYNSFIGILDEDAAEALDQIVAEQLGFANEPGERWRNHDGGMHLLAAALYRAMKEDNFDETGGNFQNWLEGAIARGRLTPDNVKRLAAAVVGADMVAAWGPHRTAEVRD